MQDGASNVLDQFRRGDPETFHAAFEALFATHQRTIYAWVLRIVRNPATAEDLTVETFWHIYRAHARLDPKRGFEGWARTIATHVALDWLRAHRPEETLPPEIAAPPAADPGMGAEIRAEIARAFDRLPPKLRVTAMLAVIEELPHREIAAALGISVAAVKVRVFRALRLLRKNLLDRGITP